MNCCDYDCNQGRNCPARKPECKHCLGIGYDASGYPCTCATPAKVAKVKNRHYAKPALLPHAWRAYMRHLAKWMLIVWGMLIAAPLIVTLASLVKGLA